MATISNGCDCSGMLKRVFVILNHSGFAPFLWDVGTRPRVVIWPYRYYSFNASVKITTVTNGAQTVVEGAVSITEDRMTGVRFAQFTGDDIGSGFNVGRLSGGAFRPAQIILGQTVEFSGAVPTYADPSPVSENFNYSYELTPGNVNSGIGTKEVSPAGVSIIEEHSYTLSGGGSGSSKTEISASLGDAFSNDDLHNEYLQLRDGDIGNLDTLPYSKKFAGLTRNILRIRDASSSYATTPYPGEPMTLEERNFYLAAGQRGQFGGTAPVYPSGTADPFGGPTALIVAFVTRAATQAWTSENIAGRYAWWDVEGDVDWRQGTTAVAMESAPHGINGGVPYFDPAKYGMRSRIKELSARVRNYCSQAQTEGDNDSDGAGYSSITREGFQLQFPQEKTFTPPQLLTPATANPRIRSYEQSIRRDASPAIILGNEVCHLEAEQPC